MNHRFVAVDTDGVHWIIEGKSDRGRDDETVQRKRDAATDLVRELISEPDFSGQRWGYLIAHESDVHEADSWADLKNRCQPVVTPRYASPTAPEPGTD